LSVASAVFFAGFSAVHLIDDFIFGVPAEFHLAVPVTMFLALAYMIALVGLIVAASQRSPRGYLGLTVAGLLILLAQLLKSAPEILQPGPWHSGWPSEFLAAGLAVSAAFTAIASYQARELSRQGQVPPI
jgi:hypothetical protein